MAAAQKKPEPEVGVTPEAAEETEVVLAPLVQAKVAGRVMHFYRGDVLPKGTDEETLENLRSLGFLGKPSDEK